MSPSALEQHRVSLVSHDDLDGKPAFKMDVREVDGEWYLYLAHMWHPGWSVMNVTDPTNPETLRFIPGPENTVTIQVQVADGKMITSLENPRANWGAVDGPQNDPDAPFTEGAYIWDIESDPTDPERLAHYKTGGQGTHRNFYNGGDYAYLCSKPSDYHGQMLTIIDISTPTDPTEVSKWWWPGQGPDDDEEPTETHYHHGPAYVQGDRAYLSYGRVGMVVLDVADPTDPSYLYHIDFGDFGSFLGIHSAIPVPDTDLVAVNNEAIQEGHPLEPDGEPYNGIYLVNVADEGESRFAGDFEPTNHQGARIATVLPVPEPGDTSQYDNYHDKPGRFGPHNQHHYRGESARLKTNEHLVTTYFNAGLRIFDISDPLQSKEVGHFVPTDPEERIGLQRPTTGLVSQLEDVAVDSRGYIYCTDPQQGLFILETDLF